MRARAGLLLAWLPVVVAIVFAPQPARAHGMRSAYLELEEAAGGRVLARLLVTAPESRVAPRFPDGCDEVTRNVGSSNDDAPATTYVLACRGSLAGSVVGVDGLGPTITEAVVLVTFADGSTASHLLTRDASRWEIPAGGGARAALVGYARLGVAHILLGADHLLFLVLLVFTLERPRRVFLAETAFTVSHTASFAATALGALRVSSAAAEACIALSLVLVAADVGRARAVTSRSATSMAFVFGLVHGLGFAGGLREIGLPDRDAGWALAGFGLGVEAGQVAFLLAALVAFHFARRAVWRERAVRSAAYAIGGVASYWLIERVLVCVRAR
jgi:hypothetical protein